MKTDNEIIAEFMGAKFTNDSTEFPDGYYTWPDGDWESIDELIYNQSWDRLMPVVEKITQHSYESRQETTLDRTITIHERAHIRTFGMIDDETCKVMIRINASPLHTGDTLMEVTYAAVADWIKRHNETKPSES